MSTVGPGLPPLSPTREEFRALAGQGNLIPIFAELAADVEVGPEGTLVSFTIGFVGVEGEPLDRPVTLGLVRLDGADIRSWPRERLGPHVGYLPQNVEIFNGTVSENIARLGEVNSEDVIKAATRANAHEFVLALPKGYDTQVGEGGTLLSAGQRQRVALARALYGSPTLVVLDEPNSNLDAAGERALAEAIRQLKADSVTLVIITHRLPLLAHVDKVMVLMRGAVEKFGTLAELFPRSGPTAAPDTGQGVVAGKIMPRG